MDTRLIYVTCPDLACAESLATDLLESGLIACANILPGMRSLYRWEGRLERSEEVVLLVKTTAAAAAPVRDRIRARHPYRTPCVLELTPSGGDPDFLAWIVAEVRPR